MIKENALCHAEYRDENLYVAINGEIDHHSAASIREKIDTMMFRYNPKKVMLDLGQVSFMDSSGLGLIIGRASLAGELGSQVHLVKASERTKKILSLAGASRVPNLIIETSHKEKSK